MKTATILITDKGFLVPSLSLVRQISDSPAAALTDLLVFLIDVDPALEQQLREAMGSPRLHFIPVSSASLNIGPEAKAHFKGHVAVTSLVRLDICRYIPEHYGKIVYVDGDMQMVGDLSPLIGAELPEGHIAACIDNFILLDDGQGGQPPWLRRYLQGLGLSEARQYFNAGLLVFHRRDWERIGPQALEFFNRHPAACKHHDQSALNATCKDRWLPVSPAYNFQSLFIRFLHRRIVRPRLVHFSGAPKPWASADSLWGPRFVRPYRELLKQFPFLAPYLKIGRERHSSLRRLRDLLRLELASLFDVGGKNRRFRDYVGSTDFLVR